MRGWTAKVGLRKPEWQCTECWYHNRQCDHPDLARKQAHRTRCRVGCPCTFTNDCPHCAEGRFHQCKAARTEEREHPCPDMSCPHCPCTYTAECCHCGDGQVHQ